MIILVRDFISFAHLRERKHSIGLQLKIVFCFLDSFLLVVVVVVILFSLLFVVVKIIVYFLGCAIDILDVLSTVARILHSNIE